MTIKQFFKLFLDAIKGKEHDYTKGSLKTALILLAVPMISEMIMESLFAIVDVFLVAKVSNEAVATVGMTEGVLMIVESVAIGISMAATAFIARRIGEKDIESANHIAAQTVLVALIFSFVTGLFAFIYAEDILRMMGGDEGLIEEGKQYTRIILSFNFILTFLFVFNAFFRSAGNPAFAMRTLIISNLINIVLDPIFIFGLGPIEGMGVTGAAVATCIGRGTGLLYQIYILFGGKSSLKILWKHFKPHWQSLKELLDVTAGGAGQFLISTASWIFLIRILAEFGSSTLAGYTIAIRIIIFSILPSWGLANATATLVGQNLGANQPDRAEETVWVAGWYNMLYLLTLTVVYFLVATPLVGFFSEDAAVIKEASLCLKIICLGYIFFGYLMIVNQAFNGAGDTKTPTYLSFVFMWLIQIPLAYIMAHNLGFNSIGVYVAIGISEALMAGAAIYLFRKGKWKLKEL